MNNRALKLSVPLIAIAAVAYLIFSPSKYVGYAPDQPIPFNHKIHAGDNKIDCKYCHTGVETSAHATVPSTSTCMNCHSFVATSKPLIKKLAKSYNDNKPIEWIKVHDMPDHVQFNHSRHISRGVDCSQCHGNVAEMVKVKQVASLNMGYCVDCHRENNAPTDCSTCHR
ncbi:MULTISPECIES: cytochrome c3 family protein [Leptospira]|uniref:Class III cytochrome c domain protein n=5 Tax=Leptospira TaxID=171 RepID=A0A828Z6H0_9LEPT|nr:MULTISPECIES: cytochrome c3 family protein [Leptospira]EMM72581.1 class III cytochrome c domain protein [Leptospira weilii str. 2006001855]EMY15603.1 class III cytochrome c domain protein [Leptospira weilii str. Ecochallenge]EKR65860.1 class III cytochrome c domain protein [Leptospira weilii str. 2006001853]EMJ59629.1 class III cytochrome c domain protein [Leptospira sp. P2653]EMN43319.1 class III cytochrome c domain protein [Leptospira weilii str. LNT 1234]